MVALGIGELVLDKTVLLDNFPVEGTKVAPVKSEASIGGPVASALILLAKLGVECYMVASVGDDEAGDLLKRKLQKEGVKLLINKVKRTKVHTVLVNGQNGSRTIIKDNSQRELIKSVSMHLIQTADIIVFDRHEPEAFNDVMFKKRSSTLIVSDPSDEVSAKTIDMLKASSIPIVPVEALAKFRRHEGLMENLKAAYEIVAKPLVVTWGGNGCALFNGEELNFYPAFDLPVADTLGAGDVFRGAFAYGLLQQWDMERTIEFSNLVAGLQCTKLGNSTAIPGWNDIKPLQKAAVKKQIDINLLIANYAI